MLDYQLHGLSLACEFPLPGLPEGVGAGAAVHIRRGAVPEALEPGQAGRRWQVAGGQVLLNLPSTARYLIEPGHIQVQPSPGAADTDVRLFLLGSALGVLMHLHGRAPLHAGVVEVQGRAVAFAADSGEGKSTLIAHLHRRGYPVLTDDLCGLEVRADGVIAHPGMPSIKLWRETLVTLPHDEASLVRDGVRIDKFHLPLSRGFAGQPLPLTDVYFLARAEDEIGVAPLQGMAALSALYGQVYRRQMLGRLGLAAQCFGQVEAIGRRVQCWRFTRPRRMDLIDPGIDCLETHWHAQLPEATHA